MVACSTSRSKTHAYRPFFLPKGIYLANVPIANALPEKIAVLRSEDSSNMSYFYRADGCSDLFVSRPERHILANNRIDALTMLVGLDAARKLSQEACRGRHSLADHMRLCDYGPGKPLLNRTLIEHGGGCLDSTLLRAMRQSRISMVTMWFQSPGYPYAHSPRGFKTEILFGDTPVFYDSRSMPCVVSSRSCYFCNTSYVTRQICERGRGRSSRLHS